jgi:hypothetical protein
MNEPFISTSAKEREKGFISENIVYGQILNTLDASYDLVLGWAIDRDTIMLLNENYHVISPKLFEVGGGNTLPEDQEILNKCHGDLLFYVKAWEPPTMDFIDFLEMLTEKVEKVIVVPVGTEQNSYLPKEKELNVWARKLSTLNSEKVWIKSSAKALGREVLNAES